MNSLVLHRGAKEVSLTDLQSIPLPEKTPTYTPISHYDFAMNVARIGGDLLQGFSFREGRYGVTKNGGRFFGVHVYDPPDGGDHGICAGMRNSLDKSMTAGLTIGLTVFVCDNESFSGDFCFFRKHSKNVLQDLKRDIVGAFYDSRYNFSQIEEDLTRMREVSVSETQAETMGKALFEEGILKKRAFQALEKEWKTPSHDAFRPRNLYSFYNCCTEILKRSPLDQRIQVHTKTHDLVMKMGGLSQTETSVPRSAVALMQAILGH